MNRLIITIIAVTAIFIASFKMLEKTQATENIKVVELFTSQGCSSCPAADRLLSQIADNKNVIALSFHVSYWNYLGWKDPYSSEQFTKRQRAYASKMNLRSIYTPQVIVNGTSEFVGSNKSKLSYEINSDTSTSVDYTISIDTVEKTGETLQLTYSINKAVESLKLNVAVVERHVKNYVPKGENRGRTLEHDNVVRTFKTTSAQQSGQLTIELPKFSTTNKFVILYLQNDDFEVKGAIKARI